MKCWTNSVAGVPNVLPERAGEANAWTGIHRARQKFRSSPSNDATPELRLPVFMKPPADRHLDISGAGTDRARGAPARHAMVAPPRWRHDPRIGVGGRGLGAECHARQFLKAFFWLAAIGCAYAYAMALALRCA